MEHQKILKFINNYQNYENAIASKKQTGIKDFEKNLDDLIESKLILTNNFDLFNLICSKQSYLNVLEILKKEHFEKIVLAQEEMGMNNKVTLIKTYFKRCLKNPDGKTDNFINVVYDKITSVSYHSQYYFFSQIIKHMIEQKDCSELNLSIIQKLHDNQKYQNQHYDNYLTLFLEYKKLTKDNEESVNKILNILLNNETKKYDIFFQRLLNVFYWDFELDKDIFKKLCLCLDKEPNSDILDLLQVNINEEQVLLLHELFPSFYEKLKEKPDNFYCITVDKNYLNQKISITEKVEKTPKKVVKI